MSDTDKFYLILGCMMAIGLMFNNLFLFGMSCAIIIVYTFTLGVSDESD